MFLHLYRRASFFEIIRALTGARGRTHNLIILKPESPGGWRDGGRAEREKLNFNNYNWGSLFTAAVTRRGIMTYFMYKKYLCKKVPTVFFNEFLTFCGSA